MSVTLLRESIIGVNKLNLALHNSKIGIIIIILKNCKT